MDTLEKIKQTIHDNPVVIFMKGTPEFPQCGFSMRTAEALKAAGMGDSATAVLAALQQKFPDNPGVKRAIDAIR